MPAGQVLLYGRWSVDGTSGFGLGINPSGRLEFWVGDGTAADAVAAEVKLLARVWYFVAVSYDPASGAATIHPGSRGQPLQQPAVADRAIADYRSHVTETRCACARRSPTDAGFLIGACERAQPGARRVHVSQCYNGKIDRCGVQTGALDRAALDAIRAGGRPDMRAWSPIGTPPPATARAYGIGDTRRRCRPEPAARRGRQPPGARADRLELEWPQRLFPPGTSGIRRHRIPRRRADRLPLGADCWALPIPADLKSGVYAVKLTAGDAEEYVPFFVRPATPNGEALCLLIPTASYLAYANITGAFDGATTLQAVTARDADPAGDRCRGLQERYRVRALDLRPAQ